MIAMDTRRLLSLIDWPPRVTHMGVSLARICYAATIFGDMLQVYRWRDTSFDPSTAWVGRFALPACMVALALFGAGLVTRFSAIAGYVLLRGVVYPHLPETTALDRVTLLVLIVFSIAPAPKALALDVRIRKAKPAPLEIVPAWFSLALLCCIEIVYGNSVLNKLRSTLWQEGLTFWLSVTLPHFSAGRLPGALHNAFLLRATNYGAFVLEALFPLVLLRPLRRWIVIFGILLHLSIAVFLPIPAFGLAFASLYLFLVDWEPVARRLGLEDGAIPVDDEPRRPPGRRSAAVLYAVPALLLACEMVATIPARIVPALVHTRLFFSFLGLGNFGLYGDFPFTIPKPIVRFVVKSGDRVVNVPSFDERGYPEITGRYWSLLTTGDLRLRVGDPAGEAVVNRYLRGALMREGVSDAEFSLYARDVSIPLEMNPNLAEDLEHRPWTLMATGVYRAGHAEISWVPRPATAAHAE
jgi:hypothetical protein